MVEWIHYIIVQYEWVYILCIIDVPFCLWHCILQVCRCQRGVGSYECFNVEIQPIPVFERHDSVSITEPATWGILSKHNHMGRKVKFLLAWEGWSMPWCFTAWAMWCGRCSWRACGFVIAHVCTRVRARLGVFQSGTRRINFQHLAYPNL